jgi:hypothetical protein
MYMVQLSHRGRPVTAPGEAAAALGATDPGHGPIEPDAPELGIWHVGLTPVAADRLRGDGFLLAEAGGYLLLAEMP